MNAARKFRATIDRPAIVKPRCAAVLNVKLSLGIGEYSQRMASFLVSQDIFGRVMKREA